MASHKIKTYSVFAHVIKSMAGVLIRKQRGRFRLRERPISASLVDAEIVVVRPQAKERQGLPVTPEAGREAWKGFPQRERTLPTPGFQTSGFQNYERIEFCCLSHPVGGHLSQKLQETNKMPFCVFKSVCMSTGHV